MQTNPTNTESTTPFDFDAAHEYISSGPEAVNQLARLLVDECRKTLQQIHNGFNTQDAKQVQKAAHTLKGSAQLFAATTVTSLAQQMEELAKAEQMNEAAGHLAELETHVARLVSGIQAELDRRAKS